jgi:hypothetical protein
LFSFECVIERFEELEATHKHDAAEWEKHKQRLLDEIAEKSLEQHDDEQVKELTARIEVLNGIEMIFLLQSINTFVLDYVQSQIF